MFKLDTDGEHEISSLVDYAKHPQPKHAYTNPFYYPGLTTEKNKLETPSEDRYYKELEDLFKLDVDNNSWLLPKSGSEISKLPMGLKSTNTTSEASSVEKLVSDKERELDQLDEIKRNLDIMKKAIHLTNRHVDVARNEADGAPAVNGTALIPTEKEAMEEERDA